MRILANLFGVRWDAVGGQKRNKENWMPVQYSQSSSVCTTARYKPSYTRLPSMHSSSLIFLSKKINKTAGCINLVDLAGSERVSRSGVAGQGLKEAQAINKSLSALGDVLSSLMTREKHVPFRNSKLTHLLQGSLTAASAKALMFVHIAPEAASAQESLCTLRFGAKTAAVDLGSARRQIVGARGLASKDATVQ